MNPTPWQVRLLIAGWVGLSWAPLALAQAAASANGGGLRFDWVISFGTVIHLLGMFLGGVALYFKILSRITVIETKLTPVIEDWQRRVNRAMDETS